MTIKTNGRLIIKITLRYYCVSIYQMPCFDLANGVLTGIVFETVLVEYSPGDCFTNIAYLKQSWTCTVNQNSPCCTVLPVFETVPPPKFCDVMNDC